MKLKQLREMLKPLALKVREAIIRRLAIARVISKGRVTVTDLQKINKSQLKTNNENIVIIPE